jgi:hypothetical protein
MGQSICVAIILSMAMYHCEICYLIVQMLLVFDCSNGRARIALQIGKMKLALSPVHST